MCLTQDDFGAAIRTSHGFCPLFDVDDLYNGFLYIFLFGISQCNRGACNEWQHRYEVPMSVYLPIRDVHWGNFMVWRAHLSLRMTNEFSQLPVCTCIKIAHILCYASLDLLLPPSGEVISISKSGNE